MTKSARNVKPIPKFRSEAKEREFWESKRLADSLLDGIRQQANKMDVPYQSLMKIWLTEKLREQIAQEESVSK
jgi:hypothetical protein